MEKSLVEQIVQEAKEDESSLVISDRKDTFTVEKDDLANIEVADAHLKVTMQDGKSTVYVVLDQVYKLVIEKEKSKKSSSRTGFGASRD